MEHGEDCCVKVAVHARPLIGDEKLQGCKDCVIVVPGKPQVRTSFGSLSSLNLQGFSLCFPQYDGMFVFVCCFFPSFLFLVSSLAAVHVSVQRLD